MIKKWFEKWKNSRKIVIFHFWKIVAPLEEKMMKPDIKKW